MEKRLLSLTTKDTAVSAGKHNNILKIFLEETLKELKYTAVDPNSIHKAVQDPMHKQKLYAQKMCVGQSIYNTRRKCDFVLFNPAWANKLLFIECKWQAESGSVDEKFPYLIANINKHACDTIILLDGNGYKSGAKKWLCSQINGHLKGVYSMEEFTAEVIRGLLD
jgi:hypothetical protein